MTGGSGLPAQRQTISLLGWAGLLSLLLAAVFFDAYPYDILAYHGPFAAVATGLPRLSHYGMSRFMEHRYQGFPPLWRWLLAPGLGLGLPRLLLLPNLLALLVLIGTCRRCLRLPWPPSLATALLFPIALFGFRTRKAEGGEGQSGQPRLFRIGAGHRGNDLFVHALPEHPAGQTSLPLRRSADVEGLELCIERLGCFLPGGGEEGGGGQERGVGIDRIAPGGLSPFGFLARGKIRGFQSQGQRFVPRGRAGQAVDERGHFRAGSQIARAHLGTIGQEETMPRGEQSQEPHPQARLVGRGGGPARLSDGLFHVAAAQAAE
jgi:hypothetical protein